MSVNCNCNLLIGLFCDLHNPSLRDKKVGTKKCGCIILPIGPLIPCKKHELTEKTKCPSCGERKKSYQLRCNDCQKMVLRIMV